MRRFPDIQFDPSFYTPRKTPEQRMCLSMLVRAIQDVQLYMSSEARTWIMSNDARPPGFLWVVEAAFNDPETAKYMEQIIRKLVSNSSF